MRAAKIRCLISKKSAGQLVRDEKTRVSYSFDATGGSVTYSGGVVGALEYHKKCTHQLCQELLTFATYLPSEIISLVGHIENHTHFPQISQCQPVKMGDETLFAKDLSALSFGLFNYLVFADRLDKDHGKYLPAAPGRPAYLKTAYEQRDSFVPLKRFLVSPAPDASAKARSGANPSGPGAV